MKTKFKVISLLLTTSALSPVVVSLSSCAPQTSNNYKYIDYSIIEEATTNDITWGELKTPNISLNSLLFGNKKFNEGNYVIMFSTTSYLASDGYESYVYDLIFGKGSSTYNIDDWAIEKNTALAEIYRESLRNDKDIKWGTESSGLAFISVNDIAKGDDVQSPFSKWVEADTNLKDPDGKDLITKKQVGKYIRNDDAAKNFRAVINKIKILFSNSDDVYSIPTQTDSEPFNNRCRDAVPYFIC